MHPTQEHAAGAAYPMIDRLDRVGFDVLGWIDMDGGVVFDADQPCQLERVDRWVNVYDASFANPFAELDADKPPVAVPVLCELAAALYVAAGYLARHGWCQDAWYHYRRHAFDPACCLAGALLIAAYGYPVEEPEQDDACPKWTMYDALFATVDGYLQTRYGVDLYAWNDQPGRTAEQVIAAVKAAADVHVAAHCGGAA